MYSPTKMLKRLLIIATLVCTFGTAAAQAQTATPSPTPTEEELRLQEQKRLLELQRDIELAKKAIRDAQPQAPEAPKPTATPLAGDTTLDQNVKLEVDIVAYRAMSEVAKLVAEEVRSKSKDVNLAIYDAQVVRDWRFYRALLPAFKAQVDDLEKSYKDLLCKDPKEFSSPEFKSLCRNPEADLAADPIAAAAVATRAFSAGTDILRSFIDLTALFRTDTKIEGKAVTIDESALVAEVFRQLKKSPTDKQVTGPGALYYPEVFPPRLSENSPTVTQIGRLYLFKSEADARIKSKGDKKDSLLEELKEPTAKKKETTDQLNTLTSLGETLSSLRLAHANETDQSVKKRLKAEMDKIEVRIAALLGGKTFDTRVSELKAEIAELEGKIKPKKLLIEALEAESKQLSELNARFQKFVDEYIKVDDKGVNAIALFIKSEDIDDVMKDGHWLEIKTVSAGGNNRVRKNLLRYFTGAKLDHSGGLIVEWTLYDKTGAVLASDKRAYYGGYKEPKKISENEEDAVN